MKFYALTRCVRSSSPIQSSPTPGAFPQVGRRHRHEPYQGSRLPRGSRPPEVLPAYTPLVVGAIPILLVPTLALESPATGRRLHQVREGLMHMQRCRELFVVAMGCQGHSTQRLSACRPLPKCLLVQLETAGRSSWST